MGRFIPSLKLLYSVPYALEYVVCKGTIPSLPKDLSGRLKEFS